MQNQHRYTEFKRRWDSLYRPTYKEKVGLVMEFYPGEHILFNRSNADEMFYVTTAKDLGVKVKNGIYNLNEKGEKQQESLFVKDWLDLPAFFEELKDKRKGEQHKLAKEVLVGIGKNWNKTLIHNKNSDVIKFLKVLKVLDIKHELQFTRDERNDKFHREAQMYVVNTIRRIPYTIDNIQTCTDTICANIGRCSDVMCASANKVSLAAEGIGDIVLRFNQMVNNMIDHIPNLDHSIVVMAIVKIISFCYLISEEENQNVKSVTALIGLMLPIDVIGKLGNLAQVLLRAVQSISSKFRNMAQIDDENNHSIISSFFILTKEVLCSAIRPVDSETFRRMTISNNKIKLCAEFLRNSSSIFDYLFNLLSKFVEIISSKVFKYYGVLPSFMKNAEIDEIVDTYQSYLQDGTIDGCNIDSTKSAKIMELHNRCIKIEAKLYKNNATDIGIGATVKIMPYIRLMIVHLNKVVGDIPPHIRNGFEGFRKKPFWVYLHGQSNIGKSSLIQPLIASVLAKRLKLIDRFDDPHNYSYFRTCGAKFFAKYNKQPIIQYNDLFQNYADTESIDEAIIELTNIVDEAPYELNMPDVESKGKVYCVSSIVLSNAQNDILGQGFLGDRCWSGGIHLYRRRNLVIEPCVLSIYRNTQGTPGVDWSKTVKALQEGVVPSKYLDFVPFDLYRIKFTDPVSGKLLYSLNLDDAIDYIADTAEKYFKNVDEFHEKLISNMKRNWAQIDDEPYYDARCDCFERWMAYFQDHPCMEDRAFKSYFEGYLLTAHQSLCPRDVAIGNDRPQFERMCMNVMTFCIYEYYLMERPTRRRQYLTVWTHIKNGIRSFLNSVLEVVNKFPLAQILGYAVYFFAVYTSCKYLFKDDRRAQTVEGNMKSKRMRIKRKMVVHGKTKGLAQYDNSNVTTEKVISENYCTFYITRLDLEKDQIVDTGVYMNSFCVGGSVFMLPRHFWLVVEEIKSLVVERKIKVAFNLMWKNGATTTIPWENLDVYYPIQDYLCDICFIRVKRFNSKRDVRHFFVRADDDIEFHESYLYGLRSRRLQSGELAVISVDGVKMMSSDYTLASIELEDIGVTKKVEISSPVVYEYYNCKTISGDCGALLMFVSNKLNGRVIAGVHVGGAANHSTGFAAPVFSEDLDDAFEYFNEQETVILCEQPIMSVAQIDYNSEEVKKLKEVGARVVGSMCNYNGKRVKCTLPSKTKIVPSLVYDFMKEDFGESTFAPARLRPFEKEGEIISPFYKGYKKLVHVPPLHIPIYLQDCTIMCIFEDIMQYKSVYTTNNQERAILDWYRTINGTVGLKQLDVTTSPGFPYICDNPGRGKRPWFNENVRENGFVEYFMNEALFSDVLNIEEKAKKGIMGEIYFIDTLKDETRPLEKVKEGKTRIFQVGPMSFTILIRKYFGAFIAHMSMTFVEGECAIGLDCNSPDWNSIVKRMSAFSQLFGCGDFSDFDASALDEFAYIVAGVANRFYDDGCDLIRIVLCKMCLQAYHIVGDVVTQSDSTMNSGIAITALFNTLVNMILLRVAFVKLTKKRMQEFTKFVMAKLYGDDNWYSIKPEIVNEFNMLTISNFLKSLGYKYTSVAKGDIELPYVDLSEVSFLKRTVLYREDLRLFVSKLDERVVNEIARWCEGDPRNMRDQIQRFNATLIEASNYGNQYYERYYLSFCKYCMYLRSQYHNISSNELMGYWEILDNCYGEASAYPRGQLLLKA